VQRAGAVTQTVSSANPELAGWLEIATHDLPPEACELVWMEIEGHYLDALDDHLAQGKSLDAAHRAAMAALGDADEAAEELCDTHLADRRYRIAVFASLGIPILILLDNMLWDALGDMPYYYLVEIALRVATLISVLYVLFAFRKLLSDYPFTRHIDLTDRVLGLVAWALGTLHGSVVMFKVVTGGADYYYTLIHSSEAPLLSQLLVLTGISGDLVCGLCFIAGGVLLMRSRHPMQGLLIPSCVSMLILGIGIAAGDVSLIFGNGFIEELAYLFVLLAEFILCSLLTLVFFRAGRQKTTPPRQVA
jgi:hypothetical protein